MSDRERWVIYPLLFLTLLLVARDKIAPPNPLTCGTLVCNRLLVETPAGRRLVHIGGHVDSGVVVVYGPQHRSDDAEPLEPRVILDDRNPGRPTLEMGADETGGYLTLFGPLVAPILKVGHHEAVRASGLLAMEADGTLSTGALGSSESLQGWSIPWSTEIAPTGPAADAPAGGAVESEGRADSEGGQAEGQGEEADE